MDIVTALAILGGLSAVASAGYAISGRLLRANELKRISLLLQYGTVSDKEEALQSLQDMG